MSFKYRQSASPRIWRSPSFFWPRAKPHHKSPYRTLYMSEIGRMFFPYTLDSSGLPRVLSCLSKQKPPYIPISYIAQMLPTFTFIRASRVECANCVSCFISFVGFSTLCAAKRNGSLYHHPARARLKVCPACGWIDNTKKHKW